jgi:hypothetical protein
MHCREQLLVWALDVEPLPQARASTAPAAHSPWLSQEAPRVHWQEAEQVSERVPQLPQATERVSTPAAQTP